ncbi:MAG TPA: RidA family protein [Thermomicrobiales bacterium]|jgi:enamine deaminase RidA (YjgF/YER057c/UK114 family)|nr:RidA family protein [Thermomicrobiales bacterium]
MHIEAKLAQMGLVLPAPGSYKPSVEGPPVPVLVRGTTAYVSGTAARNPDGTPYPVLGKVPSEVSPDEAREAARVAALTILSELKRAIGDLDRISAWVNVIGFVNADPGFARTSYVISGFSDVIIDIFGPEIGTHARSTPGAAALAGNAAVIITATVELDGHAG